MASITHRFLVPVSTVSTRNAWHNGLLFVTPKTNQKFWGVLREKLGGVCSTLPETLTLFKTKNCDFPCPISDLIKNVIPYFRPEALEPGALPECMTSCYGKSAWQALKGEGEGGIWGRESAWSARGRLGKERLQGRHCFLHFSRSDSERENSDWSDLIKCQSST